MGKNPAFQFYPSDWQRDLDDHPLEIEGAWIRICGRLFWTEGTATKSLQEWSRILRKNEKKTEKILQYLGDKNIADLLNQNGLFTITSRRMVRDAYIRKVRKISGIKGGNPALLLNQNNQDLLNQNESKPSSKSQPLHLLSSSSNSKKEILKEKVEFCNSLFQNIPEALMSKWKESCPGIDIKREIAKAEAWVISNPKLKKSNWSRFLTNWMVRAQDRAIKEHTGAYNAAAPTYTPKQYGRRAEVSDTTDAALDRVIEEAERAKIAAARNTRRNADCNDVPDSIMQRTGS